MNVAIIGIGLIGGSLAIALKNSGFASWISGVDHNSKHADEALNLGLVDEILSLEAAIEKSELVIVSVPVDQTNSILPVVLDLADNDTAVTDMGSIKSEICKIAGAHPNRETFVASHPIAGTENSGPGAAIPDLFQKKTTIICEANKSRPAALELVKKMYRFLDMEIITMEPEDHDVHLAFVSHLSHVSSFALGLTVLDIEKNKKNIFDLAGSGFSSTVRLAKSSSDMWTPIFHQNADNLSIALDAYIEHLKNFKDLIDNGEVMKLHQVINEANKIRKVLQGSEV